MLAEEKADEGAEETTELPPAGVSCTLQELNEEILRLSELGGGFGGKGLFFGINNFGIGSDGQRIDGEPLLKALDECGWLRTLATLESLGLSARIIKSDDDEMVRELPTIPTNDILTVTFYGLELVDNPDGNGTGDPRARLLPRMLCGQELSWPFVYVYANIRLVEGNREPEAPAPEEDPAETLGSPAMARKRKVNKKKEKVSGLRAGFINDTKRLFPSERSSKPVEAPTRKSIDDTPPLPSVALFKESRMLQQRAQKERALGDMASSNVTTAEANVMLRKAEAAKAAEPEPPAPPPPPPPPPSTGAQRVWKPVVFYCQPDGTMRTIEAGFYTEDDWMQRTLEEQEIVTKAKAAGKAAAVAVAPAPECSRRTTAAPQDYKDDMPSMDELGLSDSQRDYYEFS